MCTKPGVAQNTVKRAHARQVVVAVDHTADDVVLSVTDDGIGFDAHQPSLGRGVAHFTDRLTALGGAAELQCAPGTGTRMRCRVQLPHGSLSAASDPRFYGVPGFTAAPAAGLVLATLSLSPALDGVGLKLK